jgi:transposase
MMKGEDDAEELAELSKGRLRNKIPQLCRALEGTVTVHHRSLLTGHWQRMQFLERQIEDLEAQIAQRMKPTPKERARLGQSLPEGAAEPLSPREEAIQLWMEIPGVAWTSACSMVAELGVDMNQFPSAAHAASWAALCPGNNESAGKRFSGKTRNGNVWGYGGRCVRSRGPRRIRRIPILQPNSAGSHRGGARNGRWSPWPIAS